MASPDISELTATPRWFPHQLNVIDHKVLLVERSEADYRAASFLDDHRLPLRRCPRDRRMGSPGAAMPPGARRDAQYIFHIGNVGSTLISRLLGELPAVFALREPLLLRTFYELDRIEGTPRSPWPPGRSTRASTP